MGASLQPHLYFVIRIKDRPNMHQILPDKKAAVNFNMFLESFPEKNSREKRNLCSPKICLNKLKSLPEQNTEVLEK